MLRTQFHYHNALPEAYQANGTIWVLVEDGGTDTAIYVSRERARALAAALVRCADEADQLIEADQAPAETLASA